MEVQVLIYGVVLPAVLAAAVFVVGFRPWRRKEPFAGGHWATGPALAVAFLASYISVQGWRQLLPTSKREWIVHLAVAAGVLGCGAALMRKPKWLPWLAGPLLIVAIALLIKPIDNPTHALLGLWGLCGVVFILWITLEPLAIRRPGASLPLAFWVIFAGVAVIAEHTGGITFPLYCGALSAACFAAFVISLLNRRFSFQHGATPLLAAIPATVLWFQAWYDYSGVPRVCFWLPLLSIPLLWLGELPVITRRRPWIGVAVRALLAAIPVAIAIVLAINTQSSDPYSP